MTEPSTNLAPTVQSARVPAIRRTSYLAQSIDLEESSSPRLARQAIALMALAVIGCVIWAATARLDQVARADGEVIPSSSIHVLQHLEGGLIDEVLVRPGDVVEQDQVAMRLSPSAVGSELRQLRTREAVLDLRLQRLYAQVEGREPAFGALEEEFPALAAEQLILLDANRETRSAQMQLFAEQLQDQDIQLRTLRSQRGTIQESIRLIEEEVGLRKDLLDKGLTRRFTYLDVLRDLNRARGQLVQLDGLIARANQEIAEIKSRRASFESNRDTQALNEIGRISAELAEVRESINRFEDRFGRLEIKSPIRGVVQGLGSTVPGAVIPPGATVAEFVPIGDELVVEVDLNPKDVAFVSVGQEASVRVSAYDFARFGAMPGVVERLSPTTKTNEQGVSFYTVTIRLERSHFGPGAGENLILPGMVVQADIRTADRTVLDYLAKPITRALAVAFTER